MFLIVEMVLQNAIRILVYLLLKFKILDYNLTTKFLSPSPPIHCLLSFKFKTFF